MHFILLSGGSGKRLWPLSNDIRSKQFIKIFRRPGFTVEAGSGVNPLPLSQFDEIYRDNLGILVTAALG